MLDISGTQTSDGSLESLEDTHKNDTSNVWLALERALLQEVALCRVSHSSELETHRDTKPHPS